MSIIITVTEVMPGRADEVMKLPISVVEPREIHSTAIRISSDRMNDLPSA